MAHVPDPLDWQHARMRWCCRLLLLGGALLSGMGLFWLAITAAIAP